ncbi:unnamed protein product [Albugo candida]|uniref:Uncharacterized protein n=1 Tax=Albugo candida TaxID=65357 RepID=A0A024GPX4_9STRA|nr:unnamed protein product [Albugo candida]|eukprot:CCI48844.1 unnamed protein product [Albugo candida]
MDRKRTGFFHSTSLQSRGRKFDLMMLTLLAATLSAGNATLSANMSRYLNPDGSSVKPQSSNTRTQRPLRNDDGTDTKKLEEHIVNSEDHQSEAVSPPGGTTHPILTRTESHKDHESEVVSPPGGTTHPTLTRTESHKPGENENEGATDGQNKKRSISLKKAMIGGVGLFAAGGVTGGLITHYAIPGPNQQGGSTNNTNQAPQVPVGQTNDPTNTTPSPAPNVPQQSIPVYSGNPSSPPPSSYIPPQVGVPPTINSP